MDSYWDYLPEELKDEIYKFKHQAELKDVVDEMNNKMKHEYFDYNESSHRLYYNFHSVTYIGHMINDYVQHHELFCLKIVFKIYDDIIKGGELSTLIIHNFDDKKKRNIYHHKDRPRFQKKLKEMKQKRITDLAKYNEKLIKYNQAIDILKSNDLDVYNVFLPKIKAVNQYIKELTELLYFYSKRELNVYVTE